MQAARALIREALAEVWSSQGRRFVTFEVEGGTEPDRWIQYLDGELNVRWPFDEEPAIALAQRGVALPKGAFCGWHARGENTVIEVGDASLDDVALLVEALFTKVLAIGRPVRVAARVEAHS